MSHSKLQSSYNIHRIKYSSQKNSLLASTNGKQFADRFIGDFIDVVSLFFEFLQFFVKKHKNLSSTLCFCQISPWPQKERYSKREKN